MKNKHIGKLKKTASLVAIAILIVIGLAVIIGSIALNISGWFGIIITNTCTVMICWAVFQLAKPMLSATRKEEYADLRAEEEKDRRLSEAEKENAELRRRNELLSQTQSFFGTINFHSKLSLMEKTDIGYIVRNDKFEDLQKDEALAPLIKATAATWLNKESRNLLYIRKKYSKFNLGIDLEKIRYAQHQGKMYVCGVEISILNNTSADLKPNKEEDVDLCLVTGGKLLDKGSIEIKGSKDYTKLKESYSSKIDSEVEEELQHGAESFCRQLTAGLQKSLESRYPDVKFISSEQAASMTGIEWKAPGENSELELKALMSDMYIGLNLISDGSKSL